METSFIIHAVGSINQQSPRQETAIVLKTFKAR